MLNKKFTPRLVSLSLVLLMLIMAVGCGKQTEISSTTKEQGAPVAATQPVKGGTLRIINNAGPQVLGYAPAQGPTDTAAVYPAIEKIMDYTLQRTLEPFLAQSVLMDQDKLTLTIKLREGIMFTDGSELTADVAAWNYQLIKDTGKLPNSKKVASIEVKDKYTVVIHLTEWYNETIMEVDFGYVGMFSKEDFEKNGGEKWARTHVVGTGPFILDNFQRDVSMSWVRNDNYWQKDKGLPYLDRIEMKFIPEATTVSAMMQAGEADIWQNASAKDQADMKSKGFVSQSGWAGLEWYLIPNTTDPKSKWNDKRLRQALDYALDKPAIAKALGYGMYVPLDEVTPPGEWGYDQNYAGIRKYDPAKAKQLLAEAGYPNGLKINLLVQLQTGGRNETAEAIKGYLDAAGFQTNIDVADPGRYFGSVWGKGWEDLAFTFTGTGLNYFTSAMAWWSHMPRTNIASLKRPQALIDLFNKANVETSAEGQKAAVEKIVQLMTDEALVTPVYHVPALLILNPKVHTDYPTAGLTRWDFANSWIDKK